MPASGAPTNSFLDRLIDTLDCCPYGTTAGRAHGARRDAPQPLYTPEERARRDATPWTLVQGILAPVQFAVFLVSLALVARFLATGEGFALATTSIVVKTLVLYTIMITGSIWEKDVFGKWLFAPAFFWEDVFSMLVLGLQTLYLFALAFGWWSPETQMYIAVAAYAAYIINAGQFLLKLRAARLEGAADKQRPGAHSPAGGHPA
jgi:3-vinyl bacteriochlorophyllide hydratase